MNEPIGYPQWPETLEEIAGMSPLLAGLSRPHVLWFGHPYPAIADPICRRCSVPMTAQMWAAREPCPHNRGGGSMETIDLGQDKPVKGGDPIVVPVQQATRRRLCPDDPTRRGIRESDTFCWHCGKALIWGRSLRCKCGQELDRVDRFCTKCGSEVKLGE